MMYMHTKTRKLYTEVRDGPERLSRSRWDIQARSAATGRWVWVLRDRIEEVPDPEPSPDDEKRWARREMLLEMSWRLSRELPYNLGVVITNVAMSEYEGNLGVATAAIRDEIERLAATTSPEEDTE